MFGILPTWLNDTTIRYANTNEVNVVIPKYIAELKMPVYKVRLINQEDDSKDMIQFLESQCRGYK